MRIAGLLVVGLSPDGGSDVTKVLVMLSVRNLTMLYIIFDRVLYRAVH